MSYISTMAVNDGIVMMADMQAVRSQTKFDAPRIGSTSYKKLYTIGENIGVCFASANLKYKEIKLERLVNQFCKDNFFDDPKVAARALHNYICTGGLPVNCETSQGLKNSIELDGFPEYVIHVAGYYSKDKLAELKAQYPNVSNSPCVYILNTTKDKDISPHLIGCQPTPTFIQCGNMIHVHQYVKQISSDKEFMDQCNLQDAVDTSKAIFDVARILERTVDHITTISEEFEMLVITENGIQWLKKHELEVRENKEEKLEVTK